MIQNKLLMIPGPVEMTPQVYAALDAPIVSHVAPEFIEIFGQALERLRVVFRVTKGQVFILAGSGTLAMDSAAANLVESGDRVAVISTGYFGDRMAEIYARYNAVVEIISENPGTIPSLEKVEAILKKGCKLLSVTQVDTSTGVLANVRELAKLGKEYGTLVVVDGVCSIAGEELPMDEWGVDLAFTASQKALAAPPGLALLAVGSRAIETFKKRKSKVFNYYADWSNWLPVMEAYEARRSAYFGTPAVQLVTALNASLGEILSEGMENRLKRHIKLACACRAAMEALRLGQIPTHPDQRAHTMSAPRYPAGINGNEFLQRVAQMGVQLAGGLHPVIRTEYFRIGHMGKIGIGEILTTVAAIETALSSCLPSFTPGVGVEAALKAYSS